MAAAWLLCAVLVFLHTRIVGDYVAILDSAGARPGMETQTPLRQIVPARYADAQMWLRHALDAQESGTARLRHTKADNAPAGRAVHWSSAFAWLLRGAARLDAAITGNARAPALEHALLWFNGPLLLAAIVILSSWAARRGGARAGVLVAFGFLGLSRLYEGFQPTYVDHHGLVTAAVFGLLFGIVCMTRATAQPTARHSAIGSALCGALGLWLSAAAVVPMIALCGIGALAMARRHRGTAFNAANWRLWGRVGAGMSLAFYLLEYAPSHLGLRLEANHPLYALAWWGGGELVADLGTWLANGTRPRGIVLLPAIAVAAPAIAAIAGGSATFAIGDPFVGALRHFVVEGKSLPEFLRQFGVGAALRDLLPAALALIALAALWLHRGGFAPVLTLLGCVFVAVLIMAGAEMRWWLNAAAVELVILVTLLDVAIARWPQRARMSTAVVLLVLIGPAVQRIVGEWRENRHHVVAAGDLLQPLYRDIAAVLRESQPQGEIVLLADPNATAGIGYFGRFRSIGTLYWENAAGLRAAAEMFCAATDDAALTMLRARGVTHLALLPGQNFLGEYFELLHGKVAPEKARDTFGYRLLAGQRPPLWLQPIPYRAPDELKETARSVRLFKVTPNQTSFEQLYHFALTQLAEGRVADAETAFGAAAAELPRNARAEFHEAAGAALYEHGAEAAAVRQFRRVLESAADPNVATTTAWILATTRDNALRNPREALTLLEPVAHERPNDPTVLSAQAAALAELGRFPEAIAAAERAVAAVRPSGDQVAITLLERRLATFRAGRPWRQ